MINTFNETKLHNTLKKIYAFEKNGKTEQKVGNYIADITTENNEIIEIQTSNVSILKEKLNFYLSENKKVTIVYPVIEEKTIETQNKTSAEILSKRKSQRQETIYSLIRQLTGLSTFIPHKNLTIEALFVSVTEIRKKTDEKLQNRTNTRRFKKNYLITEKKLNEIRRKTLFNTLDDYKKLLPQNTPNPFTPPELKKIILNQEEYKSLTKRSRKNLEKNIAVTICFLEKIKILKKTQKKGRSFLYTIEY